MAYAERTGVPISRSQQQIQDMVQKAGAKKYGTLYDGPSAIIAFVLRDRQIKFTLTLPDPEGFRYTNSWEQACRSKWRSLYLVIKAKLEAVESGIATFDEEFLAWVVTPGGLTVGQRVIPDMQKSIEGGQAPRFLLGFDSGNGK